jgi:hypothetical protein
MFRFKGPGRVIAKVKGGRFDKKLLYLINEDDHKQKASHKHKGSDKYGEFVEIKLEDGVLIPMPNIDQRQVLYLAGQSGSGKSTKAAEYIENYKKIFKNSPFYLFSRKESDPVLDRLNPIRIPVDQNLVDEPFDVREEFPLEEYETTPPGAVIMFDDVTSILDKKIQNAVTTLICDILEIGRDINIYLVICNHLIIPEGQNFARKMMCELQDMVIFPHTSGKQQILYALKAYFLYDPDQIKRILELPSRSVVLGKLYPQYVLYDTGCYIP